MTDPLDLLGLRARRSQLLVEFGSVNVSFAARGGNVRTSINDIPSADFTLVPDLLTGQPVDYAASLTLGSMQDGQSRTIFSGSVVDAIPKGGRIEVAAKTSPALVDSYTGFFEGRDIVGPEIVHLLARMAGLPEERVHVEGLDAMLPLEAIEAIVPLTGISVTSRMRLGPVTVLPVAACAHAVDEFDTEEETDSFKSASAYAVVTKVGRRLLDIETVALAEVDAALAWLTVRARYGLALMPDGRPQAYRRRLAQARPERGELVLVRGVASGRRWLRSTTGSAPSSELAFDPADRAWSPPKGARIDLQDRLALLACARAANSSDQLERVQAVWEAIEFYVAGVRAPEIFDQAEVRRVRKSIPTDVDPALRQRALDLLGRIKDPPLFIRLKEAIRRDGVPLAEGELQQLRDLRDARNDAVHGRTPALPQADEVDHAVSIVARMLLYRLYRRPGRSAEARPA